MHRWKRLIPTFTSISSRIESLTDRRFTHGHLAQLKFILLEAIVLKKHLVLDERTRCRKLDIHISLDPTAVEADANLPPQRGRVSLKKVFWARLKEFLESHPEGDEIPEGELLEPFNRQENESISDNAGGLPIDDYIFDVLQENLIQWIKEKERMAMEERDPAITQAKKRMKNIASLPKLFDMICGLLQQRNCITKVELISKIISSCCDIVDRSVVEEQLSLLQELAPEWISEKQISSGDFLLFINKMLIPQAIRASLEEAT